LSTVDATAEDLAGCCSRSRGLKEDERRRAEEDERRPEVWRERRALFFRLARVAIVPPDGASCTDSAGGRNGAGGQGR